MDAESYLHWESGIGAVMIVIQARLYKNSIMHKGGMEGSQINVLQDCEIARRARDQEIKYLA